MATASIYNFKTERGSTFNPTLVYQLYMREIDDAVMTISSSTLTSSKALFTLADVGRTVVVKGAGSARGTLTSTISTVTDASNVVLANAASFSVASAYSRIYDPVNLTGFTARMKVKDATGAELASLTDGSGITLGGAAGTIALVIAATATATMPIGTHFYDLELINGSVVQKLFKGSFSVLPEVTS